MESVATQPPAASADRAGAPVFSVVVVFEDFSTGERARRAYDFLAANLTHEWQISSQMWKFELLAIPELREMAANDAATANLIIVSSRGDRELPAHVKDWIEMWLGCRGHAVALVALFDSPPEQAEHAQPAQTYLARVAKRGRMEFFTWPDIGLGKHGRRGSLVLDRPSEMRGGPLLPPVLIAPRQTGFSHWDIDE
jgi:hypothetical protein